MPRRAANLLALALALALSLAGAVPAAQAATATRTFSFTGAEQPFTVPAGTTSLTVTAVGGDGSTDANPDSFGGTGAQVQDAVMTVTPGQVLYVEVGGSKTSGFNGGGSGALQQGGGASDLRTIPRSEAGSLESRLLVAPGGGGAGSGTAGGDWEDVSDGGSLFWLCGDAKGGAATGSAGGAAGGAVAFCGGPGNPGTFGTGGDGEGPNYGGGGGGGWYGGGGGGGHGGGGGGSRFVSASVTNNPTFSDGDGTSRVVITYDDPVAPGTTIDSGPEGPTQVTSPSFGFVSTEPDGEEFECKFDGPGAATGEYAGCSPPEAFFGLSDGAYTLSVRATDYAGNTDQSPATRAFRVDTAAPVTDDDVPDSVQSAPVEVTLTASDVAGSGVDKTYYTTGTSPAEPTTSSSVYSEAAKPTLQDGEQIRYFSIDNAGNSDTPQSSPAAKVDADGDGVSDADDALPDDPDETSDSDGDGIGDNADDFPGHAPAAVDDSETLAEDSGATTIDVLGNDTDVDGGPKAIASATQPSNGSVVVADDQASVSYKPDAGYCNSQPGGAADSFVYTLGGGSQATVAVSVTCTGTPPVAPPTPGRCAGLEATLEASGPGVLNGTPGRDVIVGSSGHDRIDGAGGDDVICAGDGNDRVSGGTGNDRLLGGAGNDVLSGWTGRDRIAGGSGGDRLLGRGGHDRLSGGVGNDSVGGGRGDDRVSGNSGSDGVSGNGGDDVVSGGSGRDRLYGRAGDDRLLGVDSSRDRLRCGSGRDGAALDRRDSSRDCERPGA